MTLGSLIGVIDLPPEKGALVPRLPTTATNKEIKGAETIVVDGEPKPDIPLKNPPSYYLGVFRKIPLSEGESIALINHAVYSGLGISLVDKDNNFLSWLPEAEFEFLGEGNTKYAGETLDWWLFEDIDNNTTKELAIRFGDTGTAMIHPFYLYSHAGNEFNLLLKLVNPASKTEIKDLDGDSQKEIIHEFSLSGSGKLERDNLRWKDIWRLENGRPVRVNRWFPHEYQELLYLYQVFLTDKDWQPDAKFYFPILSCLKEKAELTVQGKLAEVGECQKYLRGLYRLDIRSVHESVQMEKTYANVRRSYN